MSTKSTEALRNRVCLGLYDNKGASAGMICRTIAFCSPPVHCFTPVKFKNIFIPGNGGMHAMRRFILALGPHDDGAPLGFGWATSIVFCIQLIALITSPLCN